jgi:hypothetical protein
MNKNVKKVEDFIRHFEALEQLNNNTHKELSDIDKQLANWYHRVEGTSITHISQSHKLMKEIQPILKRRRELKIETLTLRSTCDSLRLTMQKIKDNHKNHLKQNEKVLQEIKDNANGNQD